MNNVVALNNVDHHDLRVLLGHSRAFGDAVNQLLVFPTEYEEVQRRYPILFRKTDDGFRSVALLGLDRDENLFLDADGWQAGHVPVIQQRGPFLLGPPGDDGSPTVHVDLAHPRVSRSQGEPIFRQHGGNTPYLDHVLRVLRAIHDGMAATAAMIAAFERHRLIEPMQLQIALDETTRYDIPDCFGIGAARLAALDGDVLEALHRAGHLRLAFLVAASLANVGQLIERKNRRRAAEAA